MKHLHKFASVLLALVMAFSLMAPAFAADPAPGDGDTTPTTTAKVDIANPLAGHTYTAYQIFSGTQAESEGALADVQWGNGIKSEDFLTALKQSNAFGESNPFADCATAADVAAKISEQNYGNNSAQAIALAQIAYDSLQKTDEEGKDTGHVAVNGTANNLPTGYYLIVDTTQNLTGENVVYNAALLQLTQDITITTKVSVPQVDKEVKENETGAYDEAADYTIGDTVPFRFVASIPDMSQFETYLYVFHDTMSEGLTFNADSVKVTVGPTEVNGYTVRTQTTTPAADKDCTFDIVFTDLKSALANVRGAEGEDAQIVVEFTATLNSNAVIGGGGNSNTVKLEYSNNPNDDGDGNPPTGETPEDKVLVFTYELDTNKVNGSNQPLKDAEFYLAKGEGNDAEWAVIENNKVVRWEKQSTGEGVAHAGTKLTTPEDGKFVIQGLDAGTYYLWETKAPAGYNTPDKPFVVTITRTLTQTDGAEGYTELKVNVKAQGATDEGTTTNETVGTNGEQTGVLGINVVNQSGATLPETGGIGTTIFYVVGGLLTVGAVVLLVTKKRMSADSDK